MLPSREDGPGRLVGDGGVGGATFDCMHRFLGRILGSAADAEEVYQEDAVDDAASGTEPGSVPEPSDDVAEAFVERAAINGIDVFRTFDAVNDLRNLEVPAKMVKKMGKHFQGVICYSLTEPRMAARCTTSSTTSRRRSSWRRWSGHGMHQGHGGLISPYDAYMLLRR